MSESNPNVIKYVLALSVVLNIGLISYLLLGRLSNGNSEVVHQNNMSMKSNKLNYYLGRDEVFDQLPNDTNEVIMLGNSLTHNFEWNEVFMDVNIKNRGINGDVTAGVINRLPEILESKPIKIFIEIGINDIQQGISTADIVKNYKVILHEINVNSPLTKVYVQNILPSHVNLYGSKENIMDKIREVNELLKSHCDAHQVTYVDLFSSFENDNKLKSNLDCGDHLHLSGSGYLKWCELIKHYIYE